MKVNNWIINTLYRTLGSSCILCSSPSKTEYPLCRSCHDDISSDQPACPRCAMPLSGSNVTAACGNCQKHPPLYRATYSFAPYIPPLDRLIQQFKFQQKLHIGQLLGTMMAQDIALKKIPTPHILVPVPLHAKRLRQRGYNQALELAKPIAKAFNLQLDVAHCFRHKETTEQVGLSAKKRKSNIKDAFEITGDFRGKHVAIIDDVMTTGSTVNELSRQFLNVGAAHVDVWVCARAVL